MTYPKTTGKVDLENDFLMTSRYEIDCKYEK